MFRLVIAYMAVTVVIMLLAALLGEVILPEVRMIPVLLVGAGAVTAIMAWWHFIRWLWTLLTGARPRGLR